MGKIAFLFAGQGAQQPGMGKSLYASSPAAAKILETAEELRPGTLTDCFDSTPERLAQTDVTQPCVFAVGLAAAMALAEKGVQPDGAAGFSLGELAALTFAGAFAPKEGFRLVCRRSEMMQKATQENPGSMAAVLRLSNEKVEELCGQFEAVYPVNYNCDGQLVVAGKEDEMPAFLDTVKQAGGVARPLAVSGAFHSPLMHSASEAFKTQLAQSRAEAPKIPVYANLTALPYTWPVQATLAAQIQNPVRWSDTIRHMWDNGYDTFVEVGPGKVLTGLAKRIVPDATLANVQDAESLQQALAII